MSAPFAAKLAGTEPPTFDWDRWNAEFDARMASLKQALDAWAETEARMDAAHRALADDLRAIL